MTFAEAAKARTTSGVALPLISKPGATKVRPDSAGIVNSIRSSGDEVLPHSMVNLRAVVSVFVAYNQISSMVAAVLEPVWIVVPGVPVAATLIARPSVDPERTSLLNAAITQTPALRESSDHLPTPTPTQRRSRCQRSCEEPAGPCHP